MKKTELAYTGMNPEGELVIGSTSVSKLDCIRKIVLLYTSTYESGGIKSYWKYYLYPRGWRVCRTSVNINEIIKEGEDEIPEDKFDL